MKISGSPTVCSSRGGGALAFALVLGLLVAGVALWGGGSPAKDSTAVAIGDKVSSLDLLDGQDAKATLQLAGDEVTVVWFWSVLCGCVSECEERIVAFQERYKDKPVRLVVLDPHPQDTREDIEALRKQLGSPYVVHRDPGGLIVPRWGIESSASVAVFDKTGHLRFRGSMDDDLETPTVSYLDEVVDALLAGKDPSRTHAPFYGCQYPVN